MSNTDHQSENACGHDCTCWVSPIRGGCLRSQIIRQAGWIAALYALGRMLITAAGPQTNIAQFYEGTIKAGFNHNDMTVNQAWPLGADTAMPCVNTVSLEKTRPAHL